MRYFHLVLDMLVVLPLIGTGCETKDHVDRPPYGTPPASTGGATSVSSVTQPVCELNRQYQCATDDGRAGVRFCKEDRSGYQKCLPLYDAIPVGTGGKTSVSTTSFSSTGGKTYATVAPTGGYSSIVYATGGYVTASTGGRSFVTQTGGASPVTTCVDADHDGECASTGNPNTTDCNDQNAAMRHGNVEICGNGIDDDCSGSADCSDPSCSLLASCGEDKDGDGDPASFDCDDNNASMSHLLVENCNNGYQDDDCSGSADCSDPVCVSAPNCV